jgi:hypothetical protein
MKSVVQASIVVFNNSWSTEQCADFLRTQQCLSVDTTCIDFTTDGHPSIATQQPKSSCRNYNK